MSTTEERPKRRVIIGDTPETRRVAMVSATQLQMFRRCQRAWYYAYVLRLPRKPKSKGLDRGIRGHQHIKEFLQTGKHRFDRLELLGLERGYIPKPHPELLVEHPIKMSIGEVELVGDMDLVDPRGGQTRMIDWKFKNSTKWVATSSALQNPNTDEGLQMLAYGKWAADNLPNPSGVIYLEHYTFITEGRPDIVPTVTTVTPAAITEHWGKIISAVPAMQSVARCHAAYDVPAAKDNGDLSTCEKYGGCEFKETCWDRLARLKESFTTRKPVAPEREKKMGLLSAFNAPKTAAQPDTKPQPSVLPPNAPPRTNPVTQPAHRILIEDASVGIQVDKCVQGELYTCTPDTEAEMRFLGTTTLLGGARYGSFMPLTGGLPILLAPESTVYAPINAPVAAPQPVAVSEPVAAPQPVDVLPQTALISEPVAAPQPAAAAPKARRGRPAKSADSLAPPLGAAALPNTVEVSAPPITIKPEATERLPFNNNASLICLYFVGAPLGVPVQSLGAYVDQLDAELREQLQIQAPDLRSIEEGNREFGFGKWKGWLAKLALERPPATGHYVVRAGGDERVDIVATALVKIAGLVVV